MIIPICSDVGDVSFDHFVIWFSTQFLHYRVTVLYFVINLEGGTFDIK